MLRTINLDNIFPARDWVDFFEDLGYTFVVLSKITFWTHKSLYDVYKSKGRWYYHNPKNCVEINSREHFLNIIRSHKLKKLLEIIK